MVLYDCHSIRSVVPRLFDGALPELNVGTDGGTTCDAALSDAVDAPRAHGARHVLNGRFRGGWTTRHYGRPRDGVHAIQMEIAMRAYLREPAGVARRGQLAARLGRPLRRALARPAARILAAALDFAKGRP